MSGKYDFTVGQIGARIILEIVRKDPISGIVQALNVSAASVKDIIILKPDLLQANKIVFTGGAVVFTPAPDGEGDGSDGLIEAVTTLITELDQRGTYQTQAHIVVPGEDGFTQRGTFTVGANL